MYKCEWWSTTRIQKSKWILHNYFSKSTKNSWPPPKKREREKKNLKIRTSMAKAMEPFRDAHTPSWFSGTRTDVPTSHRPCMYQWWATKLKTVALIDITSCMSVSDNIVIWYLCFYWNKHINQNIVISIHCLFLAAPPGHLSTTVGQPWYLSTTVPDRKEYIHF